MAVRGRHSRTQAYLVVGVIMVKTLRNFSTSELKIIFNHPLMSKNFYTVQPDYVLTLAKDVMEATGEFKFTITWGRDVPNQYQDHSSIESALDALENGPFRE
jgi:hypothetical protein